MSFAENLSFLSFPWKYIELAIEFYPPKIDISNYQFLSWYWKKNHFLRLGMNDFFQNRIKVMWNVKNHNDTLSQKWMGRIYGNKKLSSYIEGMYFNPYLSFVLHVSNDHVIDHYTIRTKNCKKKQCPNDVFHQKIWNVIYYIAFSNTFIIQFSKWFHKPIAEYYYSELHTFNRNL